MKDMTPDQVADYLASIRAEAPKPPKKPKKKKKKPTKTAKADKPENPSQLVTVTLRCSHTINGVPYGPGIIQVPLGMRQTLLEQEGRSNTYTDTWQQERAFVIGPRGASGHSLRPVHPSFFQTEEMNAPEAASASGGDGSGLVRNQDGSLSWS